MKSLTKEQLAEQLNGNDKGLEITKEQSRLAKENNLLVLLGASDDLLEAEGTIYDEYNVWNGGEFLLIKDGEMYADNEEKNTYHKSEGNGLYDVSDDCDNEKHSRLIKVEWCPKDRPELSWRISSNIPCASFTIGEDGEPYCEGIVIDLDEVAPIS